ncbi:MAG: hypothetical protein ACRCSE_01590 [Vibrio sp.]
MQYWTIDERTKEVIGCAEADWWNIPRNALLVDPLPPKKGFAVIALDDLSGTKYIEDHRGAMIYDTSDCTVSEIVNELGPIKFGFTAAEPATQFDDWIDDRWVTNISNQYIAEFYCVDDTRRGLYFSMVDPLVSEANIKRLQGKEVEAGDLEKQALAAREKIQLENPWPVNPET